MHAMNGTPGWRQLQDSNFCRGEGMSSSKVSAHINANPSNDPKILSPSTSTILSIVSDLAEKEEQLLSSNQSNLLDLLYIWDCECISHVPGPNFCNFQMKSHHCRLIFSHVHSTCMIKHVSKKVKFKFVKITYLTYFLLVIESCILWMRKKVS